ncbi:hypothetical protein A2U01_0042759 [Trifolium medium]|uniref:Uncharacterized protein n=1 Tax=Trifolium medium TaxID=97028 RepID=A0A392QCY7_9FABA|nr:hypothetical protein [Trifolium medium]
MAALNPYIPQNVHVPVAAQAEVPGQGAPPVEEPAILAPAEGAIAPVEEPAILAPAVQHQDADDDDIDTTLSLAPPAQRRRLE